MLLSRTVLAVVLALALVPSAAVAAGATRSSPLVGVVVDDEPPRPVAGLQSVNGYLVVNLSPNLPGRQSWRYQLHRMSGGEWTRIVGGSYRNRGYFYTKGRGETFRHAVRPGTYRVKVYSGQHGHSGLITGPYTHVWPTPTVSLRSTFGGDLIVNLDPNLPGRKSWRYRLYRMVGDDWVTVTNGSYRNRGYFYTQGAAERFVHRVPRGTYRIRVLPWQHRHTGVKSDPWVHPAGRMSAVSVGGGNLDWFDPDEGEPREYGEARTCGLDVEGRLWCWTATYCDGHIECQDVDRIPKRPALVRNSPRLVSVSSGVAHSCGIDPDGAAWCWGIGVRGQLGEDGEAYWHTSAWVEGDHVFADVTAGTDHSCGVDTDGDAWCWGANDTGAIGDGTTTDTRKPVAVVGGHTVRSISAGTDHSCGVDTDGDAWCWGANWRGQLGDGTAIQRTQPVAVVGGHTFTSVSAGGAFTCGLDTDRAAWCWGFNANGRLGDGTTTDRGAPVRVIGGHAFTSISAGTRHTCALDVEGAAWCWGHNGGGRLGNGATRDRSVPVRVAGGHTFGSVSAGHEHTCGLDHRGRTWCWGDNGYGQLADGTNRDRLIPTRVRS